MTWRRRLLIVLLCVVGVMLAVAAKVYWMMYWTEDLHSAAQNGSVTETRRALRYGAVINARCPFSDYNEPALHAAVRNGRFAVARILLAHGAKPNYWRFGCGNSFEEAAMHGEPAMYELLTSYAPSRLSADDLLFQSVIGNNIAMMRYLLQHGAHADVRLRDDGESPLFYARTPEAAEFLLVHGVRVNVTDRYGMTALGRMIPSESQSTIAVLLQYGADVHVRDKDGRTPLHYAANTGNDPDLHSNRTPIVALLLAHGAAVNARAADGSTPLHEAAKQYMAENPAIAQLLLAHGADPTLRDRAGHTPLDVARRHHHAKVAKVLEDAMATRHR